MIPFSLILFPMALSRILHLAAVVAAIAAGAIVAANPAPGLALLVAAFVLMVAASHV